MWGDPITPISFSEEIVAALPPNLVRFERFADCGHGVHWDNPDRAFAVIREFIAGSHQAPQTSAEAFT
jgi:pimeloyl-ACP methyl ester carboxylesterase